MKKNVGKEGLNRDGFLDIENDKGLSIKSTTPDYFYRLMIHYKEQKPQEDEYVQKLGIWLERVYFLH